MAIVTTTAQLKQNFTNPPKGYGNVPFYWWNGDSLNKERLKDQLNILSEAAIDGLSISYIHTHPQIDKDVNAKGYGSFGRADAGAPEVFGDNWWKIWNWFGGECADKEIGLGVDDYVLGWAGNGLYVDELLNDKEFANYQGKLRLLKVTKGEKPKVMPKRIVSDEIYGGQRYIIYTEPDYILHPEYGKRLVNVYFNRFEQKMDSKGKRSLNYFFQDELQYPLTLQSWCEDMAEQFKKRKGYDILPYLAAMFEDIGDKTPQARIDYAEVLTQLAEERYFRPVYEWHNKRGLIYGCDNTGRGLEPTQYLDYFRASSWYTAPGNDAPARGSSFLPTKVSSSVTHLYNRPRTWLEAFHSMGWNSNGEWLTSQLDHHLIAGGNLLCMHGLYYSTHGGWWEWAPPCFHFRMPYWPHMKHWLRYAERMCYILSQGNHVCDIAIMYPTETLQAYPDTKTDSLWTMANKLSNAGLDYDFMDYQSLQKAEIDNGRLKIGNESYKVLILPRLKIMHKASIEKINEFKKKGGIVIDSQNGDEMINLIPKIISPDFSTDLGEGKVLHRKIGKNDLYMIMNVKPGSVMTFRQTGKVERWNAWDGSTEEIAVIAQDDETTQIRFDGEYNKSWLLMFSPGTPKFDLSTTNKNNTQKKVIEITDNWAVEPIPTMDNRWGDFRLPASNEIIGVEARETDQGVIGYAPYLQAQYGNNKEWQPYYYSWQYGVQDSPGSQGYHGLKGKVDNRFIILDKGGSMRFKTSVYADSNDSYRIVKEGIIPDSLWIDGELTTEVIINMKKGWHRIEWVYNNTKQADYTLGKMNSNYQDKRDRSAVVVYHAQETLPENRSPYGNINAMKWYGTAHLQFDPAEGKGTQTYQFKTAPGAKSLSFSICGKITQISIDNTPIAKQMIKVDNNGNVNISIDKPKPSVSDVSLTIKPEKGYPASASLTSYVKIECGEGKMACGDWSKVGALKYYSGGMRYKKDITLENITEKQLTLDLGMVDATCEVSINGSEPKILIDPPYTIDMTPYAKEGANHIEVLVYSTLSNHYQTVPTPYRGAPKAGLIGPVKVIEL